MYPIDNDDDNRHSQTRKHSSIMHTDRSSDSLGGGGRSLFRGPLDRDPPEGTWDQGQRPPLEGTWD